MQYRQAMERGSSSSQYKQNEHRWIVRDRQALCLNVELGLRTLTPVFHSSSVLLLVPLSFAWMATLETIRLGCMMMTRSGSCHQLRPSRQNLRTRSWERDQHTRGTKL